jgi:hypothetical protein
LIIASGLITEIDFDFGHSEISRIVNDQPVALPQYRTLYLAGETIASISETPSIRIQIQDKGHISKCDRIIEAHSDVLKSYIESNGFKVTNPNIKKLRSSDQDKAVNKVTHIFDDVSNNEEDTIEINQIDNCNGLDFAVFCDHKMAEKGIYLAISMNKSQFEDIFNKASQELISKEIFVLVRIKPKSIKFTSVFFSQVEYDDKVERDLKNDLQGLIENLLSFFAGECKLVFCFK